MDARQIADGLFPMWCLALWIMYLVQGSDHKDLIRVSKEGLIKFGKILGVITVMRILYLTAIAPDEALQGVHQITNMIPWPTLFGVFWEDACNALPLVILGKMMADKKWFKLIYIPLIAAMSVVFGLGHSYEGTQAIVEMSLYIPITMRLGKKYGFGTIMLCHIAYDLLTFLTLKTIAG